jgi:hypothetical protein
MTCQQLEELCCSSPHLPGSASNTTKTSHCETRCDPVLRARGAGERTETHRTGDTSLTRNLSHFRSPQQKTYPMYISCISTTLRIAAVNIGARPCQTSDPHLSSHPIQLHSLQAKQKRHREAINNQEKPSDWQSLHDIVKSVPAAGIRLRSFKAT